MPDRRTMIAAGLMLSMQLARPPEHGSGDRWFASDKVKHFFVSALVDLLGYGAARSAGIGRGTSVGLAAAGAAVVGIGKEIHDRRHGENFSLKDLSWDGAGLIAAAALLRRTK